MTIAAFPALNSTAWYTWATDVDRVVTDVDNGDYATDVHTHTTSQLPSMTSIMIIETTTGVWSNTVPVRTSGTNPLVLVSVTDPKDATNGVPGKANILLGDVWIPR